MTTDPHQPQDQPQDANPPARQPGAPAASGPPGDAARAPPPRDLPAAAVRALAEARERRAGIDRAAAPPRELSGRGGPDPVRYGDWEVKGIASDF